MSIYCMVKAAIETANIKTKVEVQSTNQNGRKSLNLINFS